MNDETKKKRIALALALFWFLVGAELVIAVAPSCCVQVTKNVKFSSPLATYYFLVGASYTNFTTYKFGVCTDCIDFNASSMTSPNSVGGITLTGSQLAINGTKLSGSNNPTFNFTSFSQITWVNFTDSTPVAALTQIALANFSNPLGVLFDGSWITQTNWGTFSASGSDAWVYNTTTKSTTYNGAAIFVKISHALTQNRKIAISYSVQPPSTGGGGAGPGGFSFPPGINIIAFFDYLIASVVKDPAILFVPIGLLVLYLAAARRRKKGRKQNFG